MGDPATNDLAETDRRCVLQVGAADHHDVVVLFGLLVESVAKLLDGGVEALSEGTHDGDMHGRREGVVGGLATIDVVVGVDGLLRPAFATGQLNRTVADDLVGVHVGLGARTGLEDHQRELVIEFSGDDLVGGLNDEVGNVARQLTQFLVG